MQPPPPCIPSCAYWPSGAPLACGQARAPLLHYAWIRNVAVADSRLASTLVPQSAPVFGAIRPVVQLHAWPEAREPWRSPLIAPRAPIRRRIILYPKRRAKAISQHPSYVPSPRVTHLGQRPSPLPSSCKTGRWRPFLRDPFQTWSIWTATMSTLPLQGTQCLPSLPSLPLGRTAEVAVAPLLGGDRSGLPGRRLARPAISKLQRSGGWRL